MIPGRLRVRFHGISRHFSPSLTFWFRSMGVISSKGLRRNLYESPGWGKPPALTTEGPETKRQVSAKQTDFRPFTSSRPWSLRSQVLVFLVFSFMFQLISRDAFAAKKQKTCWQSQTWRWLINYSLLYQPGTDPNDCWKKCGTVGSCGQVIVEIWQVIPISWVFA